MSKLRRIFVQPIAGAFVRHPETKRRIANTGEEVNACSYWIRRQRDGSVEITPIKEG